ncbi:MAG: hypothetical protein CMJ16_02295 [Peredibacter sp.]|nr:hypothetical protein [Peredibacter sp.]
MKKLIYALFICLLTASCLEDESLQRPTLNPYQDLITGGDDDTTDDKVFELPTRPDGAVFLQSGFCGCRAGEAITLGADCTSFCEGKNHAEEFLYVDVTVNEEIETSSLVDLAGWCSKPLSYINPETEEVEQIQEQAACQAQVKDENGVTGALTMEQPTSGNTTLKIDIALLDPDKTYRLNIAEVQSGASSNTIQVRKLSARITDPVGGPLATMPVNQYTCLNRTVSTEEGTGQAFFDSAARSHYYFTNEDRPDPLPETYSNIFCHDFLIYGTTPINDPLLEETPGQFTVWSKWDPRFFDLDGTENGTTIEIHKILQQKIEDQGYTVDTPPSVFFPLEYYNGPPITNSDGQTSEPQQKQLGYYMLPYVDDTTFKAYCPTALHYNSENPLFSAMKEVVGHDTEGLYIAKQENECDYILITETVLKKIWFYKENGTHFQPNDNTVAGKKVQFYWPADPDSPFIKKSHQRTYTVKRPDELSCDGTNVQDNANDATNTFPPHDKRIGCVPKI